MLLSPNIKNNYLKTWSIVVMYNRVQAFEIILSLDMNTWIQFKWGRKSTLVGSIWYALLSNDYIIVGLGYTVIVFDLYKK